MVRTYYVYDDQFFYTGISKQISKYETWPVNSTFVAPPELSAGEYLKWNGSEWAVVDSLPVEPVKSDAKIALNNKCNEKLSELENGYPQRETSTWVFQLKEAQAYAADNSTPTPFISAALSEGETVQQYADLIIANNAAWSEYAGGVVKMRRSFESAIAMANTAEEVAQIIEQINAL